MPLCPKCHIRTDATETDAVTAAQCSQCHGIWIAVRALDRLLLTHATDSTAQDAPANLANLTAAANATNSTESLRCPDCHIWMKKERFHKNIPVEIDRCEKCGYIWLDPGEQVLILQLHHDLLQCDAKSVASKREEIARMQTYARLKAAGLEDLQPEIDPSKIRYHYSKYDANKSYGTGDPVGRHGTYVMEVCDAIWDCIWGRPIL